METEKKDDWLEKFKRSRLVRWVIFTSAILAFVISTLLTEKTSEKWKSKFESIFSSENRAGFKFKDPYIYEERNNRNELRLRVELPEFTIENETNGEADSIKKIIAHKLIEYLSYDKMFSVPRTLPDTYGELKRIIQDHVPHKDSVRAIRVKIVKESIRPVEDTRERLNGYLYISFLESGSAAYADTVRLDYLNFDREKMQVFYRNHITGPFFETFAGEFYKESLQGKMNEVFFNDFFFLSPTFYLTDKQIVFHYVRERDRQKYQGAGKKYELRIPYTTPEFESNIIEDSKFNFLR